MKPLHLMRRFVGSVTAAPLTQGEWREVCEVLLASELRLFEAFGVPDQRHALHVLRRFDQLMPTALLAERRAALLHDIGKTAINLGTVRRVMATLVGPRTKTFRRYADHEQLGIALLEKAGSDVVTLALLRGDGEPDAVQALREADEI